MCDIPCVLEELSRRNEDTSFLDTQIENFILKLLDIFIDITI